MAKKVGKVSQKTKSRLYMVEVGSLGHGLTVNVQAKSLGEAKKKAKEKFQKATKVGVAYYAPVPDKSGKRFAWRW